MRHKLQLAFGLALLCLGAIQARAYPTNGTPTVQFYNFDSYRKKMVCDGCGEFQFTEWYQYWDQDDYDSSPYYDQLDTYGATWAARYGFTQAENYELWADSSLTSCTNTYKTNGVANYTTSCYSTPENVATYRQETAVTCSSPCLGCQWWTYEEIGSTRLKVVGTPSSTYHVQVSISASGFNALCPGSTGSASIPNGHIYLNGALINANGTADIYILGDGSWHELRVRLATTDAYANNFSYSITGATLLAN